MGKALRGVAAGRGDRRRSAAGRLIRRWRAALRGGALAAALLLAGGARAVPAQLPEGSPRVVGAATAVRLDAGRFTVVAYPQDLKLARALVGRAVTSDSFPGLPRPRARAVVAIAPDARTFREWTGPWAPHWGAAIAIPAQQRVVLRGGAQAAEAGDPHVVLRHELAHLALHEAMGDLPPRWFDEGYASYAAGEWDREQVLLANVALLYRRMPALDSLDRRLVRGAREAEGAYALAHRAVAELAALDPERGLTLFFRYWKADGRMDPAVRAAYGMTLDGFEDHWRSRTRRRYGVLAVLGELTLGAGFALFVVLPLYVARRRRDARRWAELREADRQALAAAAAAGLPPDAMLGADGVPEWTVGDDGVAPVPVEAAPSAAAPGEGPADERRNGRNPSLDTDFGPV